MTLKHQPVQFSKKVLFIEFYIREYSFYGKGTIRTHMPRDASFYTGLSKTNNNFSPYLAYDEGKPYLSDDIPDDLYAKIFNENTNIVSSITQEYLDNNNQWCNRPEKLISNKTGIKGNQGQLPFANFKSIAPYGFNILEVDERTENIKTDFPRRELILEIKSGQTLCFLCRREERKDGEWYTPNLNLVLFVRNYGLHNRIHIKTQTDINRMAEGQLCKEKFALRDYRKSSLNFELG